MLYNGEQIGDGSPPVVDIAVDPLEGTRLCALGMPSALAVIALAERGSMFDPGPCVYMEKMAGGEEIADLLDLDRPLPETLKLIAERKGGSVGDVTVVMLDRPRHEDAMREVREAGARIRLITDGDVSAALLAVSDRSPVDLLWGIGGTPEGVLSAAALKSMGGAAARPALAPQRRGAPGGARRRLRPRPHPHRRRPLLRRGRLLLRHRRHRRRRPPGGPLPRRRRHHRIARDALALRHRPARPRPPRSRQAARDHRRALRLAAAPAGPAKRANSRTVTSIRGNWGYTDPIFSSILREQSGGALPAVESGQRPRAGSAVLTLLAVPLNGLVLRALADGPMRLAAFATSSAARPSRRCAASSPNWSRSGR